MMKDRMKALLDAIRQHPQYLTGEEDLKSACGIVEAAALVLDRIAQDKPEEERSPCG